MAVEIGAEHDICVYNHGGPVLALAWLSEERVASAGADGAIHLWDVGTTRPGLSCRGHHDAVLCLALSPDGRYLASGGGPRDRAVRLWEAATGRQVARGLGHTGAITALAWSRPYRLG